MNKIKCAKGCCILNFTNEIHHFKNKNISKKFTQRICRV